MTEATQVPYAHEPVAGPCPSDTCHDEGHQVCTLCGGGLTAFNHLPEARGDATATASVEAGAAQVVPVQHADEGSGGEATQ